MASRGWKPQMKQPVKAAPMTAAQLRADTLALMDEYKRGMLNDWMIRLMEKIPGWTWDKRRATAMSKLRGDPGLQAHLSVADLKKMTTKPPQVWGTTRLNWTAPVPPEQSPQKHWVTVVTREQPPVKPVTVTVVIRGKPVPADAVEAVKWLARLYAKDSPSGAPARRMWRLLADVYEVHEFAMKKKKKAKQPDMNPRLSQRIR